MAKYPPGTPLKTDGTPDLRTRAGRLAAGLEPRENPKGGRGGWKIKKSAKTKERASKDAEVRARRVRISELHRRGLTQTSIAHELGVSQATVSNDLAAIFEDWKTTAALNKGEHFMTQVQRLADARGRVLDRIEKLEEAMSFYAGSAKVVDISNGLARQEAQLLNIEQEIAKLFGLYAPEVSEVVTRGVDSGDYITRIGGHSTAEFIGSIIAASGGDPNVLDLGKAREGRRASRG